MSKKELTVEDLIEERLRLCENFKREVANAAKILLKVQLELEKLESESLALRSRASIRVVD